MGIRMPPPPPEVIAAALAMAHTRTDDGTSQIDQWILDPRKLLLSEYLALPIREDRPPDSEACIGYELRKGAA